MAETNAIIGYGLKYEISTTEGGSVYAEVAEVIGVDPPDEQRDDVEATHYQSPGQTREYIPGLITPGDGSLSINWIPGDTTDLLLRGLKASAAKRNHRITFSNGRKLTFPGYIKGFTPGTPIDDRMTAEWSIKQAGAVTWS